MQGVACLFGDSFCPVVIEYGMKEQSLPNPPTETPMTTPAVTITVISWERNTEMRMLGLGSAEEVLNISENEISRGPACCPAPYSIFLCLPLPFLLFLFFPRSAHTSHCCGFTRRGPTSHLLAQVPFLHRLVMLLVPGLPFLHKHSILVPSPSKNE